jgi:hypothetical protein
LSPARKPDRDLDDLIDEITVDCNDEYEQLTGFENAFDEDANFPCPGTVVGEEVEVLSVAIRDNRRELIASCERGGRRYDIALLDIDLRPDLATSRLIAAYRRWLGYCGALNSYFKACVPLGKVGIAAICERCHD